MRDVNGEPGVSGGTRDDLVGYLAEHWGFYLANVSEAEGLTRMDGLPIHPKDQQDAEERLAEYGQRVRVVSPVPSSEEGSKPDMLPIAGTGAETCQPPESRADGL